MSPSERRRLGLAVLTAYIGPSDRRAADITYLVGDQDPREIVFAVLAVARDVLDVAAATLTVAPADILRTLAEDTVE